MFIPECNHVGLSVLENRGCEWVSVLAVSKEVTRLWRKLQNVKLSRHTCVLR